MTQPTPDYRYLDKLNDQQRAAVEYLDGPSLVIAGAGSGKTRVLTYKVVHLLNCGYQPHRILALTFTNKAAREMKDRISALVGPQAAHRIPMGTFHSIFLRLLRNHAELLGFKPSFSIYDTTDSRNLVKMIIKDLGLSDKDYKPATIFSCISNAKNAMLTPDEYARQYGGHDMKARRPMTAKIFQMYVDRCRMANAMDFDDIIFFMNKLLSEHPEVRQRYSEQFRYILVDEYQDTNYAQHLVISQLAAPDNKLCVVGDDAQSIYSFRGANINNIIDLERFYPGLKTFKLERNYRSTQNIVNASGSLIEKNTRQLTKNVYSENAEGAPVDIVQTYSDLEEASLVAARIAQSVLTEHDTYEDYAVLYRTNAQSRVLEEALRKRSMPYRIYGSTAFYQRKEVKDALAYFRLIVNPDDDESLRRIINYPARSIGETTLKKVRDTALSGKVSLWQVLANPDLYPLPVNSGTRGKLDRFVELMRQFMTDSTTHNAYEVGQLVYNRTGMLTMLAHENTPESISRQENLTELLRSMKEFVEFRIESGEGDVSMTSFLSEVMLATDQDQKDEQAGPKVTLMTAHAAKGLEFKHVYIVGVEEELFPSAMALESMSEVEEERRLLYVAMTRAKDTCMLSYAKSRFRNGQTVMTSPSRFLSDIDPKFVKMETSGIEDDFTNPVTNYRSSFGGYGSSQRTRSYGQTQSSESLNFGGFVSAAKLKARKNTDAKSLDEMPTHTMHELKKGMKIEHKKFGIGSINDFTSVSGLEGIVVEFENVGVKRLLLQFAKFNIIDD